MNLWKYKAWYDGRKTMPIDERLYELKVEFDEPISQELLDEIELIDQTIGNINIVELLRPFNI